MSPSMATPGCLAGTYRTPDGYRLGAWINRRRTDYNHGDVSPERITRLEAVEGWVWDPFSVAWEEGFTVLLAYVAEHGHTLIPARHRTADGFKLGQWASVQRGNFANKTLIAERVQRLESVGEWAWDVLEYEWQQAYEILVAYAAEHGHAQPAGSFKASNGFRLGGWVSKQRSRRSSLSPERILKLERLDGWVWGGIKDLAWQKACEALLAFVGEHGHSMIPLNHPKVDGFNLYAIVMTEIRAELDGGGPRREI